MTTPRPPAQPRCVKCNRPLSNPESIKARMGYVCRTRLRNELRKKMLNDLIWEKCE